MLNICGKVWFERSEEILCSAEGVLLVVLYNHSISQSLTNVSTKQCFTVNEVKSFLILLILVLLNSQGMKCGENRYYQILCVHILYIYRLICEFRIFVWQVDFFV